MSIVTMRRYTQCITSSLGSWHSSQCCWAVALLHPTFANRTRIGAYVGCSSQMFMSSEFGQSATRIRRYQKQSHWHLRSPLTHNTVEAIHIPTHELRAHLDMRWHAYSALTIVEAHCGKSVGPGLAVRFFRCKIIIIDMYNFRMHWSWRNGFEAPRGKQGASIGTAPSGGQWHNLVGSCHVEIIGAVRGLEDHTLCV